MRDARQGPELSVILATPGDFSVIATTVGHLQRQTVAERLELVVVAASATAVSLDPASCRGFWGHQIVEVGSVTSAARANAAGVRAARAPVVALAEDHCFPDPGWAAALLERHAPGDVAAVGPIFVNANPATLVSWCDFAIGYGPWIDPAIAGDQPFLPGHNSTYRRAVLLEFGSRLESLLEAEIILHAELRERGHRLVIEPRARTAHTNFGRLGSWLPVQFHCGRVFAAARAARWSAVRRACYAAASPLIPAVRFLRAVRQLRRAPPPRPSLARLAPLLALGLGADGLGQLLGYALGARTSATRLAEFEFRRIDHVPESDRALWSEPANTLEAMRRHG